MTARAGLVRLVALGWIACSSPLVAQETRPDATPYRPTLSTPAALSAPGWLEGEFGANDQHDRASDDGDRHRASLPYTIKYAFDDDWGVRVGGEALVQKRGADGSSTLGFGDTSVIGKRRFGIDEDSALGLEAGVLMPTSRRGLEAGSGKPDWSVNGIYSADVAGWHGDLNLVTTRFGSRSAGQSRVQEIGALALSRPIDDRWNAVAEWSGTRQHGVAGTAQLLAGVSWALRRDVVLDLGAIRALNRATPTWQAFSGVTVVIGRID